MKYQRQKNVQRRDFNFEHLAKYFSLTIFLLLAIVQLQAQQFNIEEAPAPLFRDPIFDGAADPSVIWNKQTDEWWIFYTQRRASVPSQGVSWAYGTQIGIAASADYGKTWYYKGTSEGMDFEQGQLTFWAPEVIETDEGYHMYVTFIRGIYHAWGGERHIVHFTSDDLLNWKFESQLNLASDRVIDPGVMKMDDGIWRLWYKDEAAGSITRAAESIDLFNWIMIDESSASDRSHEAPNVIYWKEYYWLLTDTGQGIGVYRSEQGEEWIHQGKLMVDPGLRFDDAWFGQHPDVIILEDRAFMFYFVHPGRRLFDKPRFLQGYQYTQPFEWKRTSLQVAELEVIDGKLHCDRNKYY